MGRLIGYARVSTADQDLSLQLEALRHAGCRDAWIFRDTASGARTARPGLEACVHALAPGDTLVVWRLDRLGRSMAHLVTVIDELLRRQVGFRSLCDGAIDTTTASGELIFHIFSALAQFERRLIQERTRAGLGCGTCAGEKRRASATYGRKTPACGWRTRCMGTSVSSVPEICHSLRISPATFYRYVALGRRTADHRSGNATDWLERKDMTISKTEQALLTYKISPILPGSLIVSYGVLRYQQSLYCRYFLCRLEQFTRRKKRLW